MKKKIFSILLAFAMCLTMFPNMAFAVNSAGGGTVDLPGDGTVDSPYLISSVADMKTFRDAVNGGQNEICAKLTKDILGETNWEDASDAIGTETYNYNGCFDGNGHHIYFGMNTNNTKFGLFGYIGQSGIVQNLAVRLDSIAGESGTIAYSNAGTIASCSVYEWDDDRVLAGAINRALDDEGYSPNLSVAVFGRPKAAGIVNRNESSGTVKDCYFASPLALSYVEDHNLSLCEAGGLVYQNDGKIENSCFLGNLYYYRKDDSCFLQWAITYSNNGTVSNCYFWNYKDRATDAGEGTTYLTKAQFESGEATYLLNNGRTGAAAAWRQSLAGNDDGVDADRGPMPDPTHGCVYRSGTEGNYTYYSLIPHEHGDKELTAWSKTDSLPTDAAVAYYLTKDVTLTTTQEISADVSICLNGHAVKGDVTVQNGSKFALTDCKEGSFDGKITVDNGGACTLNEGTFNVEVINNGAFVTNDSTLTGKDTAVTNNGTFEMNGGSITGNTKGVINNGNMNVSGAANIIGNTDNNLYLADGKTITFGELDERADIGITAEKQGALTGDEMISISANGADNLDCISADNEVSFEICTNGEGLALCRFKGHEHCICGRNADSEESVKGHETHETKAFEQWVSSGSLPETSGTYYLTKNVTLDATWQPQADADIVLCLNGKTITYDGKVFDLTGGKVEITDCAKKSWKIGTIDATAEAAGVAEGATLILYGGKLAGKNGIGISGAFEMYGGTITGSTDSGVRLYNSAEFTMYGGAITGNSTSKYGAGVYVTSGTFIMNGGEITGNSIAGGGGDGGGVYVAYGAEFIMNDGTISRNTLGATNCHGGGVFVFGTFEMNNGEIIDNSTEGAGGGVFLRGWDNEPAGSSKFIMRGGRITGNTANVLSGGRDYDTGAGVYVDTSGYFYLDKDPNTDIIITGNTKKSSGAVRNVYLGLKSTGSSTGHTISIKAPLTGTIRMGVTTAKTLNSSGVAIARADNEEYITGVKLYDIFTSDTDSSYFAVRYTATSKDIVLKPHSAHNYSVYEASGSTITVECSECGQSGGTLTISKPECEIYNDGKSLNAVLTASNDWAGTAADKLTISYADKNGNDLESAPADAGDYTASVTVGDAVANVSYTIAPKELTNPTIEVEAGSKYNYGKDLTPKVTVKDGDKEISADEYNISYENNINAGVATVKITDKEGGNYIISGSTTFTIDRNEYLGSKSAAVTVRNGNINTNVTVPLPDLPDGAVYNTPATTASFISNMKVSGTTLTFSTTDQPDGTKAEITIPVSESNNYNAYTVTVSVTIKDKDKDNTSMTVSQTGCTYGETLPDYTLQGKPQTAGEDTVLYSGTLAKGGSYTAQAAKPTEAGSYTITVRCETEDVIYTATANFEIKTKSVTAGMIADMEAVDYNTKAHNPIPEIKDGDAILTAGEDFTFSYGENTNAGIGTVTISGKGNYSGTASKNFTINKAGQSALIFLGNKTTTYGIDLLLSVSGGSTNGEITYEIVADGTCTGAAAIVDGKLQPTKAGTVKVKATMAGNDNYNAVSATEAFTINTATIDLSSIAWTQTRSFPYDGTAHQVALTGLPETVTGVTYTDNEKTYAGSYTATAALKYDNNNYELSTNVPDCTWSITAINDPAVITDTAKVNRRGELDLSKNVTDAKGEISYQIEAPLDGCSIDASTGIFTAGTTAGTCTVTVTVAPKDIDGDGIPEYSGTTGTITISVTQKSFLGGGGGLLPVQEPEIITGIGGKTDLSKDGTTITITPDEGKEIDKVLVNGKDLGAVTEVKDLKTGDKVEVIFKDKAAEPTAENPDSKVKAALRDLTIKARSKRTANGNIRVNAIVSFTDALPSGYTVKYKYYRSTKMKSGYKFMTAKNKKYYINTKGTKSTRYYYKLRVAVYNKDGKMIAQTALKQCKYATRIWTSKKKS